MNLHKITFFLFALFATMLLNAQNNNEQNEDPDYPRWIEMMQDNSANFYETQQAFNTYYANRQRSKGDGWKPFKRWEWYMESRVAHDGTRPDPDAVLNAYNEFMLNNGYSGPKSTSGNWQELGPVTMPANGTSQPNGLGRVNGIAFHPTNANIFYIAAPSGGVWKTTNGGSTWTVLTDTLPTLGASCLLVHPTNPNIIYLGSGDRDGADAPGMGVLKSTDGGITWSFANTGMGNKTVGDMLMHPTNPDTIIAATSGGIYRTTNGGSSWTKTSSSSSHFKDLEFKPNDPNTIYAAATGTFYKSTNNGVSWSTITSGLPSSGRYVIGVTPANANYVYVLSGGSNGLIGCYRSTNSGTSFSTQSTSPNILGYSTTGSDTRSQAYYDLAIAVSPTNANEIYVGGINIWKSTNGGSSWSLNAHWVGSGGVPDVHADIHSLDYSPVNSRLYCGNDGGLYYTANGGTTWPEVSSGLAIAQVYKIGQSATIKNKIINGYQDNGTGIYTNGSWSTEIGGDGMECLIDYTNADYVYGSLYYGDIRRSTNGGLYFSQIAGDQVNGINEDGGWVTPYILHVTNPNTMIIGLKNLWRSTNVKTSSASSVSWTKITNSLGGTNSQNIKVIEQSEANVNILYFARADDKLYRSDNINATTPTYTDLSSGLPNSNYFPTDIEAHPTNQNIVYMTFRYDVYKSTNKGASWTNISGNLPNISMNCIVYDTSSTNDAIYVGTDAGVYYKDNSLTNWMPFMDGMPAAAEVTELEIYYSSTSPALSSIVASTYGRGLWQSDLYSSGSALPACDFGYDDEVICTNDTVNFTDSTIFSPTSWSWSFSPGNVTYVGGTSSSSQNPKVKFPNAGYYTVALTATNANGSDTETKTNLIKVGGFNVPFTEYFETTSTTLSEWGISNPDNGVTWALATVGGITPGTRAVSVNHYNYSTTGQFDYLFSPVLNLTNLSTATLNFKHAYTRYTGYPTDSLFVYASDNCGTTWTQVLAKGESGSGTYATYPNTSYASSSNFVPSAATDWCGAGVGPSCFSVNLNSYAGNDDVMLVFATKNAYSNNLYIDNVEVSGTTSTNVTAGFTPSTTSPCTGVQVTFTNTSTGATSYVWKQNGTVISTSQNLVKTFTSAGTYQIRLVASNSTSIDSTSQMIVVNPSAGQAATPTGPTSLCVNPANSTYTTTGASYATSYQWTLTPSGAGTITGTTSSAVVNWNNTFTGNATISVKGVNSCGTGASSNSVSVNITSGPAIAAQPAGPVSLCVNPSNSTYTTSGATGATSYQWTLSPAGAGTITGTTTSAVVDWNNTFTGNATVTVKGVNNCGTGSTSPVLNVTINQVPGTPSVPSGSANICQGSPNTSYLVNAVTYATSYDWTLTPTTAGTISGTTTSAVVNWNASFTGTANITVRASNSCGNSSYSSPLTVTVSPGPGTPVIPTGATALCENPPNSTYSTSSVTNATSYSWSIQPPTAGSISGTGTTATVDWANQFIGTANIKVAGVNSCGTGTYSGNLTVSVSAYPPVPTITQSNDTLYSSSPTGNQWYWSAGPVTGAVNQYFVPTSNGIYYVIVTNANGCTAQSANYNFTGVGIKTLLDNNEVNIYPNPANDKLVVKYSGEEQIILSITNVLGQKVYSTEFVELKEINVSSYSSGVYFIELKVKDNPSEGITKKIFIERK